MAAILNYDVIFEKTPMKYLRLLAETAVMSGGLLLVIITLSGATRETAIWISVVSVLFFVLSQVVNDD